MKTATYSLITMHPSPERIDSLCVGAVILSDGEWAVSMLPNVDKLHAVNRAYPTKKLQRTGEGLRLFFSDCNTLKDARDLLTRSKSAVSVHEFEGSFVYETDEQFVEQINAIMSESVLPIDAPAPLTQNIKREKTHIRAKLRQHFEKAGIFSKETDGINKHKVVPNFPVSLSQGLNAEFALKNSVMHFTETLDFGVVDTSMRSKIWEAQAKCLTLKVAKETHGATTANYIILANSSTPQAGQSVNLLSTVGDLYMLESSADMSNYFKKIEDAAHSQNRSLSH